MTGLVVWAEMEPVDRATGVAVTVRATTHNAPAATSAGGLAWRPAIVRAPGLTLELFDGAFTGRLRSGAGEMDLSLEALAAPAVAWGRRPCRIWAGAVGDDPTVMMPLFAGRVDSATLRAGRLTLRLQVDDAWIDAPLLTKTYAGTGGAEGPADLAGTPVPLSIGPARGVEPLLVDPARSIFEFDGYDLSGSVAAAFERASAFPAAIASHPDYDTLAAALDASDVPPGFFATAPGLIGFGAPPVGVITLDLVPAQNLATPGEVIRALAVLAGAVDPDGIDQASLDALDISLAALDPAADFSVALYQRLQVSARTVIQEIAQSCNAAAGVDWRGRLVTPRVRVGARQLTLKSDGTARPAVTAVEELETGPPFWRLAMGAVRNWRIHSFDEIAFFAQLVDRGDFDAATTYREGEIVRGPDGRRYLYINPTPTAGNVPPDAAFWALFEDGARYGDGTLIDDLKPDDPNATAGADRDAAAKNKNFQAGDKFWQKIGDIEIVNDPAAALDGEYLARTSATGSTALINEVNYPIGAGAKMIVQGYVWTSADYSTADRGAGWVVRWLNSAKEVIDEDRVGITEATLEPSFRRQVVDAPVGTVFANLAARSDDLVSGTVFFDGGDLLPIASDVEARVAAPGLLNVLEHPLVKGDRINDDTVGLTDAILQAASEHRGLYFPTGPGYFITQELPFPKGMVWQGDTPWRIESVALPVQSVVNTGEDGRFEVTLDAATAFNLHKLIPEDTVRFAGVSAAIDDAGSYGLVSVDAVAKTFIVRRPGGGGSELDVDPAPDGAESVHDVIDSGSLLSFRALDGTVADGARHLESAGNANFAIRNMGFVGAGVNSSFSGGLRFIRDPDSVRPLTPIDNFVIENFRITHCSTLAALAVDGALNGAIRSAELVKNTFVNLSLGRGSDGGSNTMTEVSDIFSHQCTVPFYLRQAVYCKFWNLVAEGAPFGIVLDDCRSCDLHYGWETLKYRAGGGYPVLILRSNDIRTGPSAGFWNTQAEGFAKAGITVAGESADDQTTLAAIIDAPYHQGSLDRLPVLVFAYEQAGRVGRIHVDVRGVPGYKSSGFDLTSDPVFWAPPRILSFDGAESVNALFADFNRFRFTDVIPAPSTDPDTTIASTDPGPNDDETSGFAVLDHWFNDQTGQRWICVDNSAGAAVWIEREGMWIIEFEGRLDISLAPTTAPTAAHVTRVGRNYGPDISVHWPLWWAAETDTRDDGKLRIFLDPKDFFPEKMRMRIDLAKGVNSNLGETELFVRETTKTTVTDPGDSVSKDVITVRFNASIFAATAAVQTAGLQTIEVISSTEIVRASGSFVADGFQVGMTVKLLGFDNAANSSDFNFDVAAVTDSAITIDNMSGVLSPEAGDGNEKVASIAGYIWENELIDFANADVTLSEFSTGWTVQADFKQDDEAASEITLFFKLGRIASASAPRNQLLMRGCMIDSMNGLHTIENIRWKSFIDGGGDGPDAIEIMVGTLLEPDYLQKRDIAVVLISDDPDFDRHNRTAVQLRASNHLEIMDEQGFVAIAPEVEKTVLMPDGVASVDVYHASVEGLIWLALANGALVSTSIVDRTTVRLTRADSTGDLEVVLRGAPKRRRKPADLFGEDRSVFS